MVLSRQAANDEFALLELIASVLAVAGDQVVWATDLRAGGAALVTSLLADRGQQVLHTRARIVHHAAAIYRATARWTCPGSTGTSCPVRGPGGHH